MVVITHNSYSYFIHFINLSLFYNITCAAQTYLNTCAHVNKYVCTKYVHSMQLLNCSLHYLHKDILHPPLSTHLPQLLSPPLIVRRQFQHNSFRCRLQFVSISFLFWPIRNHSCIHIQTKPRGRQHVHRTTDWYNGFQHCFGR